MKRLLALSIAVCILLAGMTTGVINAFTAKFSANALKNQAAAAVLSDGVTPTVPTTAPTTPDEPTPPAEPEPEPDPEPEPEPEPEPDPDPDPESKPPLTVKPNTYSLTARYAFVYDATNETYLYTKGNQDTPIPMASVTKLFTGYVAMMYTTEDAVICVGSELELLDPDSSLAGFQQGQLLTVSDCLKGMLLPSGNDAAYILATFVGRILLNDPEATVNDALTAFMAEVNRQAEILGLSNSHFVTPDGIDAEGHHASSADLLQIAKLALAHPLISSYAALPSATLTLVSGETISLKNSNYLLLSNHQYSYMYYMPNAIGLKTGTTDDAGCCLISAFQKGDRIIIIGVFGTPYNCARYDDTIFLYRSYT